MAGYISQRAASLGDSWDDVLRAIVDRSSPQLWGGMLRTALVQAARAANEDLVHRLLRAGANAGGGGGLPRFSPGCTLVNAAVDGGSARVLSALLRNGAKKGIDTPACSGGPTPLLRAVQDGKEDIVKVLILAGAQVNTSDSDDSPLHCSIRRGHVQTARALLLAGALPTTFLAGTYPINLAAGLGQVEVVHDMIHKGSSVICLDAEGKTPLVLAISGGHVLTMKVLLSAESGVSAAVANGCKPLHYAAKLNQTGAIDVLVEFGVDVNETDPGGGTALYHATDMASHNAMLRLLELGASVNAADDSGLTPLHRATCLGYLAATEMLLRWGADETLPDNQGCVPAAWIQKGDAEQRLRKMLAHAPQDRAWRRRGFLVMCRARHAKLHAPARQSRRLRARRQREGAVGWTTTGVTARVGRGSGSGSSGSSATGQDHGSGGLTWLLEPANDDVFRLIIGFV